MAILDITRGQPLERGVQALFLSGRFVPVNNALHGHAVDDGHGGGESRLRRFLVPLLERPHHPPDARAQQGTPARIVGTAALPLPRPFSRRLGIRQCHTSKTKNGR